tara:strand:- start:694 stop:1173 length:480 start_codon:yes stop_codon:yes gene_type:complete
MGRVITKNRDPKTNEFGPDDFVLNTTTGDLFAKANNKLFKITSRDQNKNSSNEAVLNNITVDNITKLKEGKSISTGSIDIDGDSNNNFHIVEALISELDGGNTSIKMTTTNRIGTFVSGTLFFDQNLSGSNNYINMGNGDTNINLSGSINLATLDGGSF